MHSHSSFPRGRDVRLPVASSTLSLLLDHDQNERRGAVRNVSRHGLCVSGFPTLTPGTEVVVKGADLLQGACVKGLVTWNDGELVGLRIKDFADEKSRGLWLACLDAVHQNLALGQIMVAGVSPRPCAFTVPSSMSFTEWLAAVTAHPHDAWAVTDQGKTVGWVDAGVALVWERATERWREEKLKRVFSRLVGLAVHDLANPISSAYSTMQLVTTGLMSAKQFEEDGLPRVIEENCLRALAEIEDLLTLARDDAGMTRLTRTACDLAELVGNVGISHLARAQAKGIVLSWSKGPALSLRVDRRKILRVLGNLVSNALKFCQNQDSIVLSYQAVNGGVEISVTDSGPGIPADEMDKIFSPFNSLSRVATQGEATHGIGLAVSRSMVEAHGGTLRVQSAPGTGATFTLFLPEV